MESGKLLDSAITASSYYANEFKPYNARLNKHYGNCAWIPRSGLQHNSWIEVDLGGLTRVTGIATQGRRTYTQWVTSYTVSYSNDRQYWKFCEESGTSKIFTGNTDKTTVVTHYFENQIAARYVRLWPQSYSVHPSLRMELYGCPIN